MPAAATLLLLLPPEKVRQPPFSSAMHLGNQKTVVVNDVQCGSWSGYLARSLPPNQATVLFSLRGAVAVIPIQCRRRHYRLRNDWVPRNADRDIESADKRNWKYRETFLERTKIYLLASRKEKKKDEKGISKLRERYS